MPDDFPGDLVEKGRLDAELLDNGNAMHGLRGSLPTRVGGMNPLHTFPLIRIDGMTAMRADMQNILDQAIRASMPGPGVVRELKQPEVARLIQSCHRLFILAAGKAAWSMSRAAVSWLGESGRAKALEEILVVLPAAERSRLDAELPDLMMSLPPAARSVRMNVIYAGHPLPDAESLRAGTEAARMADGAGPEDLLLFLGSGGASAMMELPVAGISLEELIRRYDSLLGSGQSIHEMNRERSRLSQIKAGGLLRRAKPARVVQILLSDVPGDDPATIASGPFFEHSASSPSGEASSSLAEAASADGQEATGPVITRFAGSAAMALYAATQAAKDSGFFILPLTSVLQGEAASTGQLFASIAKEIARCDRPVPRPCAVLATGETVVRLPAVHGRGGRNQQLALAAALGIEGMRGVLLASLGTDGRDGPTDAAGALVDGETISRIRAAGRDAKAALDTCDAWSVLGPAGALLRTGPTGTNVNDLIVLLMTDDPGSF